MEDQQPAEGDLTAEAPATAETVVADQPERDEVAASSEAADATTESDPGAPGGAAGPEAPAEATRTRKRRLPRRLVPIVIAIAGALFVGSAAFAGATVQPYLVDRATAATKMKVARTAASAIKTLWTYTPENMDTLADRASAYLSGDFEAQYRKFVDGIVPPTKQAKVTNSTDVTGAAVESLDGPKAVVIVYTNTSSTSPLSKNIPALKYLSYRLFMERTGTRWLVTRMTTVTSLDLTPHV